MARQMFEQLLREVIRLHTVIQTSSGRAGTTHSPPLAQASCSGHKDTSHPNHMCALVPTWYPCICFPRQAGMCSNLVHGRKVLGRKQTRIQKNSCASWMIHQARPAQVVRDRSRQAPTYQPTWVFVLAFVFMIGMMSHGLLPLASGETQDCSKSCQQGGLHGTWMR